MSRFLRGFIVVLTGLLLMTCASLSSGAPEETLTFPMHFSPVTRWLDPTEGESTITPYLLLYALHDALLKPMPGGGSGPSLAESWSTAKDGLSAEVGAGPYKFVSFNPGVYLSPYEDLKLKRP